MRKEDPHRINSRITGLNQVRVVGENVEQGIFPFEEALRMAQDIGLDLVEISASADPPVCRIVDYKKFLYDLKKKQKEIKAKQATVESPQRPSPPRPPRTGKNPLNHTLGPTTAKRATAAASDISWVTNPATL